MQQEFRNEKFAIWKMQMLNHKMYTMQHNCKQCFIYLYPAHSYNKQITLSVEMVTAPLG